MKTVDDLIVELGAAWKERDEARAWVKELSADLDQATERRDDKIVECNELRAQSAERGEVIRLLLQWHEEHGIGSIKLCARARKTLGDHDAEGGHG